MNMSEGMLNNTSPEKGTKKRKILLMDDNLHLVDVLCKVLKRMDYSVIFVKEGNTAIKEYKEALEEGVPFDLLIIDLTIKGGRGGKSTIEELKSIDPDVRAIVTSGYSGDPVIAEFQKYGFIDYLLKPFKLDEFVEKIEKYL
jgi:DNA-binding NtrC family response regulator